MVVNRANNPPVRLILASSSPRRREILESLCLTFDVKGADVDETPGVGESAVETVQRLALGKARLVAGTDKSSLVIGADTLVTMDGRVLGKPDDVEHAVEMLLSLGGRTHNVLTGVAFLKADEGIEEVVVCRSEVTFKKLTDAMAREYAATGEPLGKAGGYAIQGAGWELIDNYKGSLSNIIGFPVTELLKFFIRFGTERLEWAR